METKIKNIDLARIISGLRAIGNIDTIEDFKTNYALAKNMTNLAAVEKAYAASFHALVKKYVKKNEHGAPVIDNTTKDYEYNTSEDRSNFIAEREALDEMEIPSDINLFKLKLSVLQNTETEKEIQGTKKRVKAITGTMLACINELIDEDVEIK